MGNRELSKREITCTNGDTAEARYALRIRETVVPASRDRIAAEGFALTGAALNQYERARRHARTLPDKSLRTTEHRAIGAFVERLQRGHRAAVERLLEPGARPARPEGGPDSLRPRSLKINVSRAVVEKLWGSDARAAGPVKVRFGELRASVVPDTSLVAFENPVAEALHLHGLLGNARPVPQLSPGEPISAVPDPTPSTAALGELIAGRLDDLRSCDGSDLCIPNGSPARQSRLLQGLDDEGQALVSAADATAYYDFYDLRIAWRPVWSEAIGEQPIGDAVEIPELVARMLSGMRQETWVAYLTYVEREGEDWEQILRDAARFQIEILYSQIWRVGIATTEQLQQLAAYGTVAGDEHAVQYGEGFAASAQVVDAAYRMERATYHLTVAATIEARWAGKLEIIRDEMPANESLYAPETAKTSYGFPIFAPGSVNYGLLFQFQQRWKPLSWQVGDLINTTPLSPKETRRYSKRVKETRKRSRREIESSLAHQRSNESSKNKVESEVINRAHEQTSFQASANGAFEVEVAGFGGSVGGSTSFSTSAAKDSSDRKKKFRDAVSKAARELREERKLEIFEETGREVELTTTNEITNPNEEITVTYLFYELQRRYEISEKLHKLRAVALVANDVPSAGDIDWEWTRDHAWILKRVLLDDSLQPALDHVLEGKAAIDLVVAALEKKVTDLQKLIETATAGLEKLRASTTITEAEASAYSRAIASLTQESDGAIEDTVEWIFGGGEGGQIQAYEGRLEFVQQRIAALREAGRVAKGELAIHKNALDRAVESYNQGVLEAHRKKRAVERLIGHIQDNILHYMQAIWAHEPPDQRYLRLFNREVPFFDYPPDDEDVIVRLIGAVDASDAVGPGVTVEVVLPPPPEPELRRLDDIIDLDSLIGFKGNYMIFPLREQCYVTAYMMQSYVGGYLDGLEPAAVPVDWEPGRWSIVTPGRITAVDPDLQASHLDDLQRARDLLESWDRESFHAYDEIEITLTQLLRRIELQQEARTEEIIVPTDGLYIEALPGRHPVLEDFKLRHREVDVLRAVAELKAAQLENLRLEGRLRSLDFSDASIDKVIHVDGASQAIVDTGDGG